jgi:hypothetical protein
MAEEKEHNSNKSERIVPEKIKKIVKYSNFDPTDTEITMYEKISFQPNIKHIFIPKLNYKPLFEAVENKDDEIAHKFISRFRPKPREEDMFKNIPINEPLKFSIQLLTTAINNGMIFLINYKGQKDDVAVGHERVIYPMVLGKSSSGKLLLRAFHLKGWSVSNNDDSEKIWRLFRCDRILSMTFTGSFFRMAPNGYNMNDKGMRGGILARADFGVIRRNQNVLLKKQQIQDKNDLTVPEKGLSNIEIVDTRTKFDLKDPFKNTFLTFKAVDYAIITLLKSIFKDEYIAVLGMAAEAAGSTIKVFEKGRVLGTYKTVDTVSGKQLKMGKVKNVKGKSEFNLYLFKSKK